jgi:flavin-binding protein dodecin
MLYLTIILKKTNIMSVIKVVELMSSSKKSWEDATAKAVKKASKSIKGIKSAYVQSQSVVVKDGEVSEYRVNLKISFEVK